MLVAKRSTPSTVDTAGSLAGGAGWAGLPAGDPLPRRPAPLPGSTHLRIRALMSRSHDVRALSCPPSWSAWPLFVAGTRTRMSVPVIMPRMGDTWRAECTKLGHRGPGILVAAAPGGGTQAIHTFPGLASAWPS